MSEPDKLPLRKQGSLSHIEQSIKIIPCPPQQAPVTIYPGPKAGNQNLSKADLEIADRLEKLRKRSVEELPTEEDVASRLANLMDLPSDHFIKSSYRVPFERPDTRTNVEKSDSLLKQVMEEVSLDSKVPKPEDEIQARLSRLKGEVSTDKKETPEFNTVLTAECAGTHADEDEVVKLMRDAGREVSEAKASLKSLKKDKELFAEVKKISSKKKRGDRRRREETDSTSSDELMSGTDDEKGARPSKVADGSQKEDVDRIVNLYSRKARQKKLKAKTVPKSKGFEDSDSSDTESSDSNDLKSSDSERFSD